ncbi:MAG: endonuclease III [Candidatus Saccharicenans sp.]|nr:MAG: endonuclease III [Candidatus Aminicenantes bacterium]HEK86080.1 endonuclease III [Candidatus Aminicenantes bacterium]
MKKIEENKIKNKRTGASRKRIKVEVQKSEPDNSQERERVKKIIELLRKEYPETRTALHYRSPFELLIATILAAQCTDERVNKITPALFQKYPTVKDFAEAQPKELENDIRSTGFFRHKARNIIALAQKLLKEYGGQVPDSMDELVKLPGVARKTANIVLSSAFKKAEGIAVDTHVRRLVERLGLSKHTQPEKIENDLMAIVPKSDWLDFNYLLVDHGRKICQARKPRCLECVLKDLCPSFGKFIKIT